MDRGKTKKVLLVIGMAAAVILAVAGWFLLPDRVTVQIGLDGKPSNTMPKLPAVSIPALISVIGGIIGLKGESNTNKKGIVLLCLGIILEVITILVNR